MFYKYEIKNIGNEECLFLYLTLKYEFSKELTFNSDKKLNIISKDFIKTNNINFHGNKVYLVVDDIVVKSIDFSKDCINYSYNKKYTPDNFLINIKLDDNSICEITLREYLLGILFSKYMNNIDDEVLKAVCILYNTYAYKMMKEDNYILAINSFSSYKPSFSYKSIIDNYNNIYGKLNYIIDSVQCIYISYNGEYILPFIHYSNSGKTQSSIKYPYLSSIKSLWDIASPYYLNITDFSFDEINKRLKININSNSDIIIINDSTKKIKFDNNVFSIEELKNILNLRSNNIYLIINNNYIRFITIGWGNSLGLSIYGANEIAKNGGSYYNILNYYFPKTKLYKYIKEL